MIIGHEIRRLGKLRTIYLDYDYTEPPPGQSHGRRRKLSLTTFSMLFGFNILTNAFSTNRAT
jgi:hypothetical protein